MAIKWDFIGDLEGGQQLTGYVPAVDSSQSGVTIATGVDLGQRSGRAIDRLAIPDQLKSRLKPYASLKKQAAVDRLAEHPLTISRDEADALDRAIGQGAVADIGARYDRAVAGRHDAPKFGDLSDEAQTVICSVAFQYGADLARRTPRFWRACTEGRWPDLIAELRNFGDNYPTRRNKEADLLNGSAEITGITP